MAAAGQHDYCHHINLLVGGVFLKRKILRGLLLILIGICVMPVLANAKSSTVEKTFYFNVLTPSAATVWTDYYIDDKAGTVSKLDRIVMGIYKDAKKIQEVSVNKGGTLQAAYKITAQAEKNGNYRAVIDFYAGGKRTTYEKNMSNCGGIFIQLQPVRDLQVRNLSFNAVANGTGSNGANFFMPADHKKFMELFDKYYNVDGTVQKLKSLTIQLYQNNKKMKELVVTSADYGGGYDLFIGNGASSQCFAKLIATYSVSKKEYRFDFSNNSLVLTFSATPDKVYGNSLKRIVEGY